MIGWLSFQVFPDVIANTEIPWGSFVTCSGDGTVRIWNIETGFSQIFLVQEINNDVYFILHLPVIIDRKFKIPTTKDTNYSLISNFFLIVNNFFFRKQNDSTQKYL